MGGCLVPRPVWKRDYKRAVVDTAVYDDLLDALSEAAVTFDQVESIGLRLWVPRGVIQRVRAEHRDSALCAVKVIQEFRNDCELSPSDQNKKVASALRRSRLSAVATRLCKVPLVRNLPGTGLQRPPLHQKQDTLNIPTKAKKRQHPSHVLCIGAVIIVVVLMIGFVWQMKSSGICQPYIPPMNVDSSDIMSSDKLDKVNTFNPAAPDKPDLYDIDRNQPGVKIHVHISDCTIICTAVVLVLVAIIYMYLTNGAHSL